MYHVKRQCYDAHREAPPRQYPEHRSAEPENYYRGHRERQDHGVRFSVPSCRHHLAGALYRMYPRQRHDYLYEDVNFLTKLIKLTYITKNFMTDSIVLEDQIIK